MAVTKPTILLTSALEDAEVLLNWVKNKKIRLIHLPLEKYVPTEPDDEDLVELLKSSENIIYGHKRNAKFFMKYVQEQNLLKLVTDRVNLAAKERTAEYLEEEGVPAIYPGSEEPIKMLEFLMRLRRLGTVFYPCGSHKNDEIPGLLSELDIDVQERIFYELQGPSTEELETYKAQLQETEIDLIVYHSRRSVNRTQAAFPELTSTHAKVIAGDNAVAEKLNDDHKIQPDETAEGSWKSIIEKIEEVKI